METNAFAPLGVLQIPYPARLLTSACCIDKDLVALISRLGGQDRLSLWNYTHGYKVWEVGVGGADETIAEIIGLAWSPDGTYEARLIFMYCSSLRNQDRVLPWYITRRGLRFTPYRMVRNRLRCQLANLQALNLAIWLVSGGSAMKDQRDQNPFLIFSREMILL